MKACPPPYDRLNSELHNKLLKVVRLLDTAATISIAATAVMKYQGGNALSCSSRSLFTSIPMLQRRGGVSTSVIMTLFLWRCGVSTRFFH
ncbi:MAG: hypothetical protein AB7V13_18325, partial [Pseudorhodoplanes sp.]